MKKVIICGDCGSRAVTRAVIRACSESGGAFVCDGAKIYETCPDPKFLIITACTLTDISCNDGIIVFGKALCQIRPDIKIGTMIPVVDTSNIDALTLLKGSNACVVGCSMSGHDTISVSGIKDFPSKLISLQRNVRPIDGETIEPHEFTVRLSREIPVYPLLASCSVLLLSGEPSGNGYQI